MAGPVMGRLAMLTQDEVHRFAVTEVAGFDPTSQDWQLVIVHTDPLPVPPHLRGNIIYPTLHVFAAPSTAVTLTSNTIAEVKMAAYQALRIDFARLTGIYVWVEFPLQLYDDHPMHSFTELIFSSRWSEPHARPAFIVTAEVSTEIPIILNGREMHVDFSLNHTPQDLLQTLIIYVKRQVPVAPRLVSFALIERADSLPIIHWLPWFSQIGSLSTGINATVELDFDHV